MLRLFYSKIYKPHKYCNITMFQLRNIYIGEYLWLCSPIKLNRGRVMENLPLLEVKMDDNIIEQTGINDKTMVRLLKRKVFDLEEEKDDQEGYIRNCYKKFGRIFQYWVPFSKKFTQEERDNFVFVGQPIDGIIFKKDEIVFVEIKTNGAILTENQKRVRELVKQKKISFREVRFK